MVPMVPPFICRPLGVNRVLPGSGVGRIGVAVKAGRPASCAATATQSARSVTAVRVFMA
jgi:hypothetical protein